MSGPGAGPAPRISAVITTYNRLALLPRVLEPLLADPGLHEVVVVDDAGQDGSARWLESRAAGEPRLVPVVLARNAGQPRARAAGVERATGDLVLSLDDDVVPGPLLASGHARRHQEQARPRVVLGYMPTATPDRRRAGQHPTYEYARYYELQCEQWQRDPADVFVHFWGGNFSVPRQLFLDAVAGHHFPLRYHEDRDLGLRLARQGAEPVFDKGLVAVHEHSRAFAAYLREGRSSGHGTRLLHALHPDVLGPFDGASVLGTYRPAVRRLVRASTGARRPLALAGLHAAAQVSAALRLWPLESRFASTARHVEEWRGAQEADAEARVLAAAGPPSVVLPAAPPPPGTRQPAGAR